MTWSSLILGDHHLHVVARLRQQKNTKLAVNLHSFELEPPYPHCWVQIHLLNILLKYDFQLTWVTATEKNRPKSSVWITLPRIELEPPYLHHGCISTMSWSSLILGDLDLVSRLWEQNIWKNCYTFYVHDNSSQIWPGVTIFPTRVHLLIIKVLLQGTTDPLGQLN